MNRYLPGAYEQEIHLRLLRIIAEADRSLTQREMSRLAGISIGKTNYCIRALIQKGMVKAQRFKNAKAKAAYIYKLTPAGLEEKLRLAAAFLKRKLREYEALRREIESLQEEVHPSKEQQDCL